MSDTGENSSDIPVLECPFCGVPPTLGSTISESMFRYCCDNPNCRLDVQTFLCGTKREALEIWNTRVSELHTGLIELCNKRRHELREANEELEFLRQQASKHVKKIEELEQLSGALARLP
jgi:hypothetical protein